MPDAELIEKCSIHFIVIFELDIYFHVSTRALEVWPLSRHPVPEPDPLDFDPPYKTKEDVYSMTC